jgi:hypothetical protein
MSDCLEKLKSKLTEYGLQIQVENYIEEHNEIYLATSDMSIFFSLDEDVAKISFIASLPPEIVASDMLILKEVDGMGIVVMESYIFNSKKQLLNGEEARQYFFSRIGEQAIRQFTKEQIQMQMLLNCENCHEC